MPSFRIAVTTEAYVKTTIPVEAETHAEALVKACEQAKKTSGDFVWEYDGLRDGATFVAD
jgi:hypothetical protein